jgi:hypothetical protein
LLRDIAYACLLLSWPSPIGHFITIWLPTVHQRSAITEDFRENFLAAEPLVHDPRHRLFTCMQELGFLRQLGRGQYIVAERQMSPTAFWLMLLDRFAPEPAIVDVAAVLA